MWSDYELWWEHLTPFEREHTRACAAADCVDEEMLMIFAERGSVGLYGVRWVGESAGRLSADFLEFVRARQHD